MTTIFARRAPSLRHAFAIGIAAAIMAGTASARHAAARPPANGSETGWQSDLVNRPGCWAVGDYAPRSCTAAGLE